MVKIMSRFKIVKLHDPVEYKETIKQFWDEYLTDTPYERYKWLESGNPAGKTIWFLAFKDGERELAGAINVMPKDVIIGGETIKIGLLGDYMVSKKFRVFGPAIHLPKAVMEDMDALGIKTIISIPNDDAKKVHQKAGICGLKMIHTYVKPIDLSYYFSKRIKTFPAEFFAGIASFLLKIFSKEPLVSSRGCFRETDLIDESFNVFWNEYKEKKRNGFISDHSSEYLKWRYLQNPLNKFRILTYCASENGKLEGYAILCPSGKGIYINDILVLNKKAANRLVKKIISIARKEKRQAVYMAFPPDSEWHDLLKYFYFVDAKFDLSLCYYSTSEMNLDGWVFLAGDRNI